MNSDQQSNDKSKVIGKGSTGLVKLGFMNFKDKTIPVAIKVIKSCILAQQKDFFDIIHKEIDTMKQIQGNQIVNYYGHQKNSDNLFLYMQYCDGGNLATRMKPLKKKSPESETIDVKKFPESEALEIAKQIISAFCYLRKLGLFVIHRFLEPKNIYFHKGSVKVGKWGLAKFVDGSCKDKKENHTIAGIPLYMSPQMLKEEEYTYKTDLFSLGVILFEMIVGEKPWNGDSIIQQYREIKNNKPINKFNKPNEMTEETWDLVKKLLAFDENHRITWEEAYKHPAFEKIIFNCDDYKELLEREKQERLGEEENKDESVKKKGFLSKIKSFLEQLSKKDKSISTK